MATIPSSIPAFTPQGVLPPFLADPASVTGNSPHRVTLLDFIQRYATSVERKKILRGYLNHRHGLLSLGIHGFQWIDGSFVEDIEKTEGRPPRDVDIVTFHGRTPALSTNLTAWNSLVQSHPTLFDRDQSKPVFKVDAFFVDFCFGPVPVVGQTAYWYSLFAHKRITGLWKGMLQIPLDAAQDVPARDLLTALGG